MLQAKLENFTEKELSCRCCGKLVLNDKALIALQAFRYYLNRKYGKNIRITVNCGTRCQKHNKEVGGVANSQHLLGIAFDLVSPDLDYKTLYQDIVNSKLFSTVIRYDKSHFVHADTRERANYGISSWAWDK